MPQAMQIETQSEQQSLTLLRAQRAARSRAGTLRFTELNRFSITFRYAGLIGTWPRLQRPCSSSLASQVAILGSVQN